MDMLLSTSNLRSQGPDSSLKIRLKVGPFLGNISALSNKGLKRLW